MLLAPFKAVIPQLDKIGQLAPQDFSWDNVKELFPQYFERGLFIRHDRNALYIYKIISRDRQLVGLVANVDIQNWHDGSVKPHEKTQPREVEKQMQRMLKRGNAIKPLLLVHRPGNAIKLALWRAQTANPPMFSVVMEDGEEHVIYQVADSDQIDQILHAYDQHVEALYIADGHHRAAATMRIMESHPGSGPRGLFGMLVDHDQVVLHDYSRWISGLNNLTPVALLEALQLFCVVDELTHGEKPVASYEMTMLLNNTWYSLLWRPSFLISVFAEQSQPTAPQLLNDYILTPLLGIQDPRDDKRLQYIDGSQGHQGIEQAAKHDTGVGFCLHPLSIEEVYATADCDEVLPPKSTWFEPRVKNGIIIEHWYNYE
jgi:uncharacterized protein (DUF1015 family)